MERRETPQYLLLRYAIDDIRLARPGTSYISASRNPPKSQGANYIANPHISLYQPSRPPNTQWRPQDVRASCPNLSISSKQPLAQEGSGGNSIGFERKCPPFIYTISTGNRTRWTANPAIASLASPENGHSLPTRGRAGVSEPPSPRGGP
ncbi:hypothetical protein HYPSUDRAFT_208390 [Hypholoma sublateritium FD-334 SS-4]|uniref:Uncharacterized protein n=1 Tax=Hypholoma sublateritium (strain FD-334 SS-4) TaxID=945553 RepID=A0A0D2KJL9_HYPSF|nr:hypothetical protein HYPSUDRAFT_208390 [Hypholoma sublateritium FD-334 SS-4]